MLGKVCLLAAPAPCQEQFIEEMLLRPDLAASVRLKLVAPQFIQHLALLSCQFISLELLLQPLLELSQLVLQQIAIPLQGQFMFVGLLQVHGVKAARKLCGPQLSRGSPPRLDLHQMCVRCV